MRTVEKILEKRATYSRKQPKANVCKVATEKKNMKQKESVKKEMKRAGATAIESGAAPGAVVSLKVDYCTHSHAQGLQLSMEQRKWEEF